MLRLLKRLFSRPSAAVARPEVARFPRATPASQPIASDPAHVDSLFGDGTTLRRPPADVARVKVTLARLRELLAESDALVPPFPVMALRISVFLKKGDPDTNELVKLIGQDPAIAAKVLQVANSALYAPTREVDTVRTAVTQMGTKAVSSLVLAEATRSLFDRGARGVPDSYRHLAGRLFHDSATSAYGAGGLAIAIDRGRIDRVFLAGMLHDLGKALALRLLGAIAQESGELEPDALEEVLELVHIEAGQQLHARWQLPDGLAGMCAHHHDEEIDPGPDGDDLHVLRVASGVVAHLRGVATAELQAQVLHSINALAITPARTRVLVTETREYSRLVTATYGLDAHLALVEPNLGGPAARPHGTRAAAG